MSRPWDDTIYNTGLEYVQDLGFINTNERFIYSWGSLPSDKQDALVNEPGLAPNSLKMYNRLFGIEDGIDLRLQATAVASPFLSPLSNLSNEFTIDQTDKLRERKRVTNYFLNLLTNNIMLNLKELFYLYKSADKSTDTWEWKRITSDNFSQLKEQPNKYIIVKLGISEHTRQALIDFGYQDFVDRSGCAAHHDHSEPIDKYFILSTSFFAENGYFEQSQNKYSDLNQQNIITHNEDLLSLNINITTKDEATFSHTNPVYTDAEYFRPFNFEPNNKITNAIDSTETTTATNSNISNGSTGVPYV